MGIRAAAIHHLHEQAFHISLFPFHKMMRWNIPNRTDHTNL